MILGINAFGGTQIAETLGIFFCLALVAFMAASEIALTRMSLVRALALEDEGRRGARRVVNLLRDPAPHLSTILLLTLVGTNGAAILGAALAEHLFGNFGLTIATFVVTILLFVLSEAMPKTFALQHTEQVAFLTFPVIRVITPVLRPISRGLIAISNLILPGRGLKEGPFVSEAEIRQLVDMAGEEASIEADERQMIHSVFEFNDTVVREVMVPRPDMVVVDIEAPIEEVLEMVISHGFSRIPAYREDIDHIEGVVYAKDILAHRHRSLSAREPLAQPGEQDAEGEMETAEHLVRPASFVPETKRISELLREMQREKFHMAIVFDEYGGNTGLVTLEDLIEEIVGEIVDEYDTEEPQVVVIDEDTLRVNGRLPIDEVNELLDAELPEGEWDTVAGLIVGLLGRIPEPEETVRCDGMTFTAEKVEGHRVLQVRIHRLPASEEPEPAEVM